MNSTKLLQKLTSKKHILFTDKGNTSIKLALKLMKKLDMKNCYLQDQGGWITYRQFAKKFNIKEIKTNYGLIDNLNISEDSFLIINSLAAYSYYQDMSKIIGFIINDVSGSIGTDAATKGEIILGSFGRWKPVNLNYGGFIATDNLDYYNFLKENLTREVNINYDNLHKELTNLNNTLTKFYEINKKIKKDLKTFDIINKDLLGINVIIKYKTDNEKQQILNYCTKNSYEFTNCPMYIRILEKAICIEVKRL